MTESYFHRYEPGAVVRASGPDAESFLQGQFSNDLKAGGPGACVYGLWLDRKGKIAADSFALRPQGETFLLASYFCSEASVLERLDAYLIMDEVELSGETAGYAGVVLAGEAIAIGLGAMGLSEPGPGRLAAKGGALAFPGRRGREPVIEVLIRKDAGGALEALEGALRAAGVAEASAVAMKARSVAGCTPRIGLEFGGEDLPQEIGLEGAAVSYRKGCYLGQEVMARIHAMGRVRKRLVQARIKGGNTFPSFPVEIVDEGGKKRGSLRAEAEVDGERLGLAVVNLAASGGLRAGGAELELCHEEASDG